LDGERPSPVQTTKKKGQGKAVGKAEARFSICCATCVRFLAIDSSYQKRVATRPRPRVKSKAKKKTAENMKNRR